MNTRDLAKFGTRELEAAKDLIDSLARKHIAENTKDRLTQATDLAVEFNPRSGYVFLIDAGNDAFMLNGKLEIEQWDYCTTCGNEDFKSQLPLDDETQECEDCHEVAKS